MSSDFKSKKLREVIELVIDNRGRNPKEYSSTGIPVIDNYLITSDGQVNLKEVNRFIDEQTYNTFLRKYVQYGDVLMTLVGNGYGKVAITPKEQCAIIQNTVGFRCNNENSNKFLYYLLRDNREIFMNLNRGAAQPSIKVGDILDLEFQFPSKENQENISNILGVLDDRIALLRQTNATLEAIAQALFKSWFVDFDPVHANAGSQPPSLPAEIQALFPSRLVESPQGLIPEGWEVGCLSNLCTISSGKRPDIRCDNRSDTAQIPLYGGAGIMGYTDRTLFDEKKILTGRVGTLGKVHVANPPFWASDNVLVLTPKNHDYFYFSLNWLMAIDVSSLNRGSTQPLLTQKDLGAQQRAIPPKVICNQFDSVAQSLYQKIEANNAQAERLSNLRDTLLPRLISGQLRLSEAEAALAEV